MQPRPAEPPPPRQLAGRLQLTIVELAGCAQPGTLDVQATATGVTTQGKHWSQAYRKAYESFGTGTRVSKAFKNHSVTGSVAVNSRLSLPLIGPVSRQYVMLELRRVHVHHGRKGDTVTSHKTAGLARLLLYPIMEGAAADGGGPEHALWLELRTRDALVHSAHSRLSDDGTRVEDTPLSRAPPDAVDDDTASAVGVTGASAGGSDGSRVVGRLKVIARLEVDPSANAAACFRPEQPLVLPYPQFSASRLLHAIADVTDSFANPALENFYDLMSMLNWESPIRTFAHFYFWLTCAAYAEWAAAMIHVFVLHLFLIRPLNQDYSLTDLVMLMMHPEDYAPRREKDFSTTHYDVLLLTPSTDLVFHALPRHHHLGPYPSVKHVRRKSEARDAGVRTGDVLIAVEGTFIGRESLETVVQFLKDLESEALRAAKAPRPVRLTFKRRTHGMHAASARKLAADATKFLATVLTSTGGALVSGGKAVGHGVGSAVKHALAKRHATDDDDEVINDVEAEVDRFREHLDDREAEEAAMLGKRVDSILTGFITGSSKPEQLMMYDSVTGKLSMAVNGEDFDAAWVEPDPNNPTSLGLTMQAAMTNCESIAAMGKSVAHLFNWHDPVTTRNAVLALCVSFVAHCVLPNRYIYVALVTWVFSSHTSAFNALRFYLAGKRAVSHENAVLAHGARLISASLEQVNVDATDLTLLLEYQQLEGGTWKDLTMTATVQSWCQPSRPRLLCRRDDVHVSGGREWAGDWTVARLVSDGGHPPTYVPMPDLRVDSSLIGGWEYASNLQDLSSLPVGRNPDEPLLGSRFRCRLWMRRLKSA